MNMSFSPMNLIRYVVGYVFIISGLMLLVSPELHSVFMKLPVPTPLYVMYLVAILEIVCGALLLANKEVKIATIPLLIIMTGAILFTKVPVLHNGFLDFAFSARLDIAMLVLLVILYKSNHNYR
ncbi:DoxX family protein [Fredinandcohnia humi]